MGHSCSLNTTQQKQCCQYHHLPIGLSNVVHINNVNVWYLMPREFSHCASRRVTTTSRKKQELLNKEQGDLPGHFTVAINNMRLLIHQHEVNQKKQCVLLSKWNTMLLYGVRFETFSGTENSSLLGYNATVSW